MNQSNQHELIVAGSAAVTGPDTTIDSQANKSPPYLKLNADCWEHVFDYLSFKDICMMGQSCKRMNQMAGYYVREYYPELEHKLVKGEIQFASQIDIVVPADFYQYISKLQIHHSTALNWFSNFKTFDSLKTLIIGQRKLTEIEIGHMQNSLKDVESIHLAHCLISGHFFRQLANYCQKLKVLNIHNSDTTGELFSQNYPTLENLQYRPLISASRNDQLKNFLEKHLKLNNFAASCYFLWENRDSLIQTSVRLDLLNIFFERKDPIPFDQFVIFLNTLYERGFYKTLKLTYRFFRPSNIDDNDLKNAISTLPALEKLSIPDESFIDLTRSPNLKEFYVEFLNTSSNTTETLATLAMSFPKLERLGLGMGFISIDAVLPFVRHSKKLKTIECPYVLDASIDLFALNQERKKLPNACKISICVPENIYLHEKWKPINLELDLVKIVRTELNYDFLNF